MKHAMLYLVMWAAVTVSLEAREVAASAVPFIPAELDLGALTAPDGGKGETAPGFRFRGAVTFLQYAKAGEPVKFTVNNHPLGKNRAPFTVAFFSPRGERIGSQRMEPGANTVSFTAKETGVYRFSGTTSAAVSFDSAMPGQGMAAKPLGMFATRRRSLYFEAPEGAKEIMIYVRGDPGEPISVRIYDGRGQLMGELENVTLGRAFRHHRVFPNREIWRIEIPFMREDSSIELGGDLNPVLALTPELLLRGRPRRTDEGKGKDRDRSGD